jgi:hypothetical protein
MGVLVAKFSYSGLAEFRRKRRSSPSSSRRRVKPHKRRLKSGKVVKVDGKSNPTLRNLELTARSARSLTYSADTIQRMVQRSRKAREMARGRKYKVLSSALGTTSKEGRQWTGVATRGVGEARKWLR